MRSTGTASTVVSTVGTVSERVLSDLYDAASVTTTAPTFVILAGGKGVVVRGSPTAEKLARLIRERLRAAKSGSAPRHRAPSAGVKAAVLGAGHAKIVLGATDLASGRTRISFVVFDAGSRPVSHRQRGYGGEGRRHGPVAETRPASSSWALRAEVAELNIDVGYLHVPRRARTERWRSRSARALLPSRLSTSGRGQRRLRSGAEPVSIENPTLASVTDAKEITTVRPPDIELLHTSVAEALAARRPFVVTFTSPLFCRKRACGPVVDVVGLVADRWRGQGVEFIDVEVYERNNVRSGYNPWMRAGACRGPLHLRCRSHGRDPHEAGGALLGGRARCRREGGRSLVGR